MNTIDKAQLLKIEAYIAKNIKPKVIKPKIKRVIKPKKQELITTKEKIDQYFREKK